jgi:hypothetical protein
MLRTPVAARRNMGGAAAATEDVAEPWGQPDVSAAGLAEDDIYRKSRKTRTLEALLRTRQLSPRFPCGQRQDRSFRVPRVTARR